MSDLYQGTIPRLGPRPDDRVQCETGASTYRYLPDKPLLVLTSDFGALDGFGRGSIVFPLATDRSDLVADRAGYVVFSQLGEPKVRYPMWQEGAHIVPLAEALQLGRELGISARLVGREVVFQRDRTTLPVNEAISLLGDIVWRTKIPAELRASNAFTPAISLAGEKYEPNLVLIFDSIQELHARIEDLVGRAQQEVWHFDWKNDHLTSMHNGDAYFDLQLDGNSGDCIRVGPVDNRHYLLFYQDGESLLQRGIVDASDIAKSTSFGARTIVKLADNSGFVALDLDRALQGSGVDIRQSASIVSREASCGSLLSVGHHGVYNLYFHIGGEMEQSFAPLVWRTENGQVLMKMPEGDRAILSISVTRADGMPASSSEMLDEMREVSRSIAQRFVKSHHDGDWSAHARLPIV